MRSLLFVLLLFLAACENNQPAIDEPMEEPEEQVSTLTYLALGDSYTIGEDVGVLERWPVQLAARLREDSVLVDDPDIIARTGWTTDELIAAIDASTEKDSLYDMVSLLIGVNNQYRGYPLDQYKTELPELINTAIQLANGDPSRVFMLSIPDYGLSPFGQTLNPERIAEELDIYNAVADSICQSVQVAFYDITEVSREFGLIREYVALDDLHPSGKMYEAWVNEVYHRVKALIK
ncbi:MAG: SGNH/GDSL hydrolase family protein [Bacteroidota bacterium]